MNIRSEAPENARQHSTRNRILDSALLLFNSEGVAKVSTNRIAAELGISSGNLYYHFKSKEQIAERLILRFEAVVLPMMAGAASVVALDDLWITLHLGFEALQTYRFIYRDADYLFRASPKIAARVQGVTARAEATAQLMCLRLVEESVIRADPEDVSHLALQMVFTATCWFGFLRLLPARDQRSDDSGRAAYQVLTLLTPYLNKNGRRYLAYLSAKYLK